MERFSSSAVLAAAGVRHGFSTRRGGVSSGRFASLNLGGSWGDDPDAVAENLRLLSAEAGFDPAGLCQVAQVHGRRVIEMTAPERRRQEADGMVTAAGLTLGVLSADCVSLLLGDGRGRVAAAHAGWRGTAACMAGEAVRALAALGARPDEVRAALGPSIGPCCFEVGDDVDDVAATFRALVPPAAPPAAPGGRPHVDLYLVNRTQLLAAGVRPEHIEDRPPCTVCDPDLYFSYRRDGAGIGQHLAFITGGRA
jgi:polyphenol oxidase